MGAIQNRVILYTRTEFGDYLGNVGLCATSPFNDQCGGSRPWPVHSLSENKLDCHSVRGAGHDGGDFIFVMKK
jgi:hypothetical protein